MKNVKQEENATPAAPSTKPRATGRRIMLDAGIGAAAVLALGSFAAACSDDDGAAMGEGTGGKGSGGKVGTGGSTGTGGKGTGGGTPNESGGKTGSGGKATGTGGKGAGGAAGMDDGGMGPDGAIEIDVDVEPLNALLTAEYKAITAYSAGASLIMGADPSDPLYALRQVIVDVAVAIQSQHKLHAAALVEAIEGLKGVPVDETKVSMTFTPPGPLTDNPTISNVLKFAASAERGAAVAYNQVIETLESAGLRFLASSIEGDETQHFIVLAALVLGLADPGPNLASATAGDVVPAAFVYTVGKEKGLDAMPPDYFS